MKILKWGGYTLPNLSVVTNFYNKHRVYYNRKKNTPVEPEPEPIEPQKAGDVAYWDGTSVKVCSLDSWSSSKGTPIGVVVIPRDFTEDGKTRIVSLKGVDSNGNASTSENAIKWSSSLSDTSLTNYNIIPITDNAGSTTTSSRTYGYLPSDDSSFNKTQSYVDSKAKYKYSKYYIPSPYICDSEGNESINPAYYEAISGYNNACSDFNGLNNTQTLVGLGTSYLAANACWKYKDGSSNLQWYLPSAGELGIAIARLGTINNTITNLSGVSFAKGYLYSSTEYASGYAYGYDYSYGTLDYYFSKTSSSYKVRPFAIID